MICPPTWRMTRGNFAAKERTERKKEFPSVFRALSVGKPVRPERIFLRHASFRRIHAEAVIPGAYRKHILARRERFVRLDTIDHGLAAESTLFLHLLE